MLLHRIDDIKYQAEKFGTVRDVYLPKVNACNIKCMQDEVGRQSHDSRSCLGYGRVRVGRRLSSLSVLWQDYYTGEMRGIGFVEFADERTAEDAQRGLDRMFLEGREVRSAGLLHNV